MGRHFSDIRKQCPQLEGVGGSEAIYEWLNYYSPELLVKAEISKAFSKTVDGRSRVIVFPLKFLGEGILCETGKTYQLWVPVPLAGQAGVQKVRILEADKLVFEAEQLSDERITVSLILSKQNQDSFVLEITVRTPDQGRQTLLGRAEGPARGRQSSLRSPPGERPRPVP